jgi:hypothetical protein
MPKTLTDSSVMNNHSVHGKNMTPLTNSERFLLAVAYLEAMQVEDDEQAILIKNSVSTEDFMMGMTVLSESIYTVYEQKTGEGKKLIAFLRQFGQTMQQKD